MMNRADFLRQVTLMTAFAGATPWVGEAAVTPLPLPPIDPVLLPPRPPLQHNGGMDIRVWVRSEMTNGVFSNVECAVAPKTMGPPPHYHLELDELMYVVEGTASVLVGDEVVQVPSGGWHLRPRNFKHTFWNASEEPLRFFDMYFNQPFEQYLEQIFHELTEQKGYPEGSDKKTQQIMALNDKFGVKFPEDAFAQRDYLVKAYGLR